MLKYFKQRKINISQVRVKSAYILHKRGFSLVEMLVAIGIFMSIMTIAVSSLISIIGATKKAQSIKSTIDSVTFALENISKDMRVGSDYRCSADGVIKDCSAGGTVVRYTNAFGNQMTYTFNGKQSDSNIGVLTVKTDSNAPVDLISQDANVNITDMKFYVIGAVNELASGPTRTQPRVIVTISGLISIKGSANTAFNLQTTISQRTRR